MPPRPSTLPSRYLVAFALVALATLLRFGLATLLGASAPYAIYHLAVFATAWHAGRGPGLAAVALSAACSTVYFVAPLRPDATNDAQLVASLGLFVLVSTVLALVAGELRRVQNLLREERDLYATTLRGLSDGVVLVDAQGRVEYANPAAEALSGRPRASPARPPLDEWLGTDGLAAQLPGQPLERELVLTPAAGEPREVLLRSGSSHAAGPARRSVLVLHDLTATRERDAATAGLLERDRQLRLVFNASRALLYLDRDFHLVWANRALRERHGLDEGDSTDLATLVGPRARTALEQPLHEAMAGKMIEVEWSELDPSGQLRWWFAALTPDIQPDGSVHGCVVLCVDTTTQRRAEMALRRGEHQKRGVLDNLPELVWIAEPDGACNWFNYRWAEYTGTVVGDWAEPMHEEDHERAVAAWLRAHAHGEPFSVEARYRRHDGALRWHLVRVRPLRDADEAPIWGWCGTATDIDDQKRAEGTLRNEQHRINAFLGTLSHELRNPLAALSAAVQVVRHPRASPAMVTRATDTLERQTGLLRRMVDELLDVTRLIEGRIDLQRRCVAVGELLHDVCVDLSAKAESSGVQLDCQMPAREVTIDGDLLRIKQAVENLVLNALSACSPGQRVEVSAIAGLPGEAGIRVADNGRGLAPEELAGLLDGESSTLQGSLSGLGLKAVRRIVQLHGGRLEANSGGTGKGTTFDLFFPLYNAQEAARVAGIAPMQGVLLLEERILVIASTGDRAAALATPLEQFGAQVRQAASGFEGLRVARDWLPTVVICSLDLPSPLSGIDVARLASEIVPRPRLVAFNDEEPDSPADGFDDCLVGPVSMPRLLAALARPTPAPSPAPVAG
jgi:PAS domain S-box-containing protein